MIQRIFSILFICLSIHFHCVANTQLTGKRFSFETYTNSDGLSHNNVRCIFQDSKGFLWIGTNAGLNRFDGKNFLVFKCDPKNPKTISANNIYGICEDKNQNIWVATEFGLTQIIRDSYECNRFYDTTGNYNIENNIIQNVFCDSENCLWMKNYNTIVRVNLKTGKATVYKLSLDIFQEEFDHYHYPIFQDSQGILWIGTDNGLGYYEPMNDEFIFFRADPNLKNQISDNRILSIHEDSKKQLWIGTQNGLNLFNKKTKQFKTYYYSTTTKSTVNGISEGYNPNFIWITTESNGVFCFDTKEEVFSNYIHTAQRQDISTNQTSCVTKSYGNILWFGTQNGLNKLDVKPRRFQLLGNEDEGNSLKYNYTTAIYKENNLVFFGTKFGGLQIYDMIEHTKKTYSADKGNFPTNHITSIIKFSDNEMLIGCDGFLILYHIKNKSFISIDKKFPELQSFCLTKKRIKCLLLDSHENLWIGTNYGIIVFDTKNHTITHFDATSLPSNQINCIYENYKSKIVIGTENGVCAFNYKNNSFQRIDVIQNIASEQQKRIYDITEDYNGNLWFGTNIGLIKYNFQNNNSGLYSMNDGLSSNEIYSVLINGNDIWAGTDNGLNAFIPDSNICRTFSLSDGIQDYEFSPHAAFKTSNGFMFFGGTQGINIFHPDSIKTSSQIPNLEFLNLDYTEDNQRHELLIKNGQNIVIPWNNSNINISFVALEYTKPLLNQYKYFISGQNDWIELNNQNYINIVQLPVGKYLLKVMAANDDGIWSAEKSISITVTPPFWKTKLAYFIEALICILIILIIIRLIVLKRRRAEERLARTEFYTQKLETQQEELEIKNKNILDSITYAKRIQSAIMPARAKFKQLIPNYFILYMPKDIVSGDFYWVKQIENKIFIVCADCTGHGVPGAFMSIIGNNLLQTTTKRNIHKASEILDYLNKSLIELFTKNELDDESAVKDGMDISICVFHTDTGILEFSGALTRMILVRNKQSIIYRGDKNPVGLSNDQDILFTTEHIRVQQGDRFYMFSDGYADQFGGTSGKKMKFKKFKHNILSIQHLPMAKQGIELKKQFQQWQGEWEQVDDVIVIGFEFDNYLKKIYENESN
ncbi:MAG: SpoIIE family protein phosphatase [Bacteroidales bacterium]|nr:SpoIIE family protein phosphatase [Bacteroidales bacterium]